MAFTMDNSITEITAAYNAIAEKPVKKFADKKTALARYEALVAKAMVDGGADAGDGPADEADEALKAAAVPAPAVTKAPRAKLEASILVGGGLSSPEESRRAPLGDTAERVKALVALYGGKGPFKMADAAVALGVEAQEVKRRVKRLRSWYGELAVTRKGGEVTINVSL